jgi:ketosteroid isomerase-like protein
MADMPFDSPQATETAFYRAFAATDLGAMARIWLSGEEARCIHPGGDLLAGAVAILESWRQIFAGAAAATVQHRLLHRTTAPDLSIHLVEERIGPADATADRLTRVIATNVYRQTPDGWRILLHHATLPLVEERKGQGAAARGGDARRLH